MLGAIVFDFDGVVTDSEPLHWRAFDRVAKPLGVSFSYEEYLRELVGFDDRDAFRAILGRLGVADERRVTDLCRQKQIAFEAVVQEGVRAIPGVTALIHEACAQMPIAIASGATRRDIDLILGRLELQDYFKTIVTADDVSRSKPDPETYRLAVSRLGLDPGVCLSIEDTAAGVASARGAGLMTLGLDTLGRPESLGQAMRVAASLEGVTLQTLRQWYR